MTQFNKLVDAANKKAEPTPEVAPAVKVEAPVAEETVVAPAAAATDA